MLIGVDARNLEGKRTGVGRYVFNLLREWNGLRPVGVKFVLYFKNNVPADLPRSSLFGVRILKTRSNAKFTHWDLPRAAEKDKVDILFCPAYVAPLFYRGKIALTLHDISYEAYPREFNWPSLADRILLKWVSKKSARRAAVIFTPSEFSRREIIKYYGVSAENIIVTPLSVDESLSDNFCVLAAEAVKKKYQLGGDFIFYAGSIFTRRHLAEIIEAFIRLAGEKSGYQLLIAGRDYTANGVVNKLVNLKNEKLGRRAIVRIDFIDDCDLKSLYGVCAFFIWLSDYEGFGLPPLEAMASGAPVIASDGTSLREIVGEATVLIKNNGDVEEIYRAMKTLIEDDDWRRRLMARGREQAAKFSWSACAASTLEKLLNCAAVSGNRIVRGLKK